MDCLGGVAKPTLGTPADRSRRAFVAAEATVLSLARDGEYSSHRRDCGLPNYVRDGLHFGAGRRGKRGWPRDLALASAVRWVGGILAGDEALKATVNKAGQHCHAKGQKLWDTRAVDNRIIFRCVSGEPKPQ